ncbi:hypothetical protein BUH_4955 [Burkholderia pseudomallei Pakistan 9]|nr:hypothetical protein BUH_4955 [Burkholderia pseudomallei Pakistan 9]
MGKIRSREAPKYGGLNSRLFMVGYSDNAFFFRNLFLILRARHWLKVIFKKVAPRHGS